MKRLNSVHEVIAAVGGEERIADLLGVGLKSVQQWKWKKVFPAKTYLAIVTELGRSGLSADQSLWSFVRATDKVADQPEEAAQ